MKQIIFKKVAILFIIVSISFGLSKLLTGHYIWFLAEEKKEESICERMTSFLKHNKISNSRLAEEIGIREDTLESLLFCNSTLMPSTQSKVETFLKSKKY